MTEEEMGWLNRQAKVWELPDRVAKLEQDFRALQQAVELLARKGQERTDLVDHNERVEQLRSQMCTVWEKLEKLEENLGILAPVCSRLQDKVATHEDRLNEGREKLRAAQEHLMSMDRRLVALAGKLPASGPEASRVDATALRHALLRYGDHLQSCRIRALELRPCTCGFDQVLKSVS